MQVKGSTNFEVWKQDSKETEVIEGIKYEILHNSKRNEMKLTEI